MQKIIRYVKGCRKISDNIFMSVFRSFELDYPECHVVNMFVIQKRLKKRNIFLRVHIAVNGSLFFHDIGVFVCKKSPDSDIEFFLFIRKLSDKRREQAAVGSRFFDPENIWKGSDTIT